MDEWGWEQIRPWLTARTELPVDPEEIVTAVRARRAPMMSATAGLRL